jgi:hypothetical protein
MKLRGFAVGNGQGLTLVHSSIQYEPFLPLNIHPKDPLKTS